jgi:cytochrome c biogenesis factor
MTDIQDPAATSGRSLTRRVGRGVVLVLGTLLSATALMVLLSAVLMSVFDSAEQWQAWRTDHYWTLATWRLLVYAFLVASWLKLKARLSQSKRTETRKELRRLEVMVILLFVMIELSKAFLPGGGIQ